MTGICAIVADRPLPWLGRRLTAMDAALVARGRCAPTRTIAAGVALSCRRHDRLSPRRSQPTRDGVYVVGDIRLDNRDDLARTLGLAARPRPSDLDLVLGAWRAWGESCASRLSGEFAFALWDARSQTLFCARDHAGVRPLFFAHLDSPHGPEVFVASEIKALTRVVEPRIDESRLGDYLNPSSLRIETERTLYAGIRRLPPACAMVVRRGTVTRRRYWTLPTAAHDDPCVRALRGAAGVQAFHGAFTRAVEVRMRGTSRPAAMLSGGLDSSSIVAVARAYARRVGSTSLQSISAVFDHLESCDERRFIDLVSGPDDAAAHRVVADRLDPIEAIERRTDRQDELIHCPNLFMHEAMYAVAGAAGADVVLDGFDGDTVVGYGFGRLTDLFRAGRPLRFVRESVLAARRHGFSPARLMWQRARRSVAFGGTARRYAADDDWLAPDFARRLRRDTERATPLVRGEAPEYHHRMTNALIGITLEVADRAAVEHGIRTTWPFFDRAFVELCARMPAEQRLSDGWSRLVQRRAMAGVLPAAIRWRADKSDLGPLLPHTLTPHRERLHALARSTEAAAYVDPDLIAAAVARERDGQWSAADTGFLYQVLSLESWLGLLASRHRTWRRCTAGLEHAPVARTTNPSLRDVSHAVDSSSAL